MAHIASVSGTPGSAAGRNPESFSEWLRTPWSGQPRAGLGWGWGGVTGGEGEGSGEERGLEESLTDGLKSRKAGGGAPVTR